LPWTKPAYEGHGVRGSLKTDAGKIAKLSSGDRSQAFKYRRVSGPSMDWIRRRTDYADYKFD